jgi:hypothetical protein
MVPAANPHHTDMDARTMSLCESYAVTDTHGCTMKQAAICFIARLPAAHKIDAGHCE